MFHLNRLTLIMEMDLVCDKISYCLGCLSSSNNTALSDYKIRDGTFKSIIQMDEICLCYICKNLAWRTELFIKNVQGNQMLLNIHNKLTNSVLESARIQSQMLCLTVTKLDAIEVEGNKDRDLAIKVEVKDENEFLDHLNGEFIEDNNDFQESTVKDEDDDFPLKDLLKEKFGVERLGTKLRKSVRSSDRRTEKKVGRRKKHLRKKREIEDDCSKEDFPLSNLLKNELVADELGVGLLDDRNVRETNRFVTRKDLYKTEMVYITREQCMEERVRMGEDKKYLSSVYKCTDCIKGFNFRESYDKHMESHSETMGDYECDICKQRMCSKDKLARHRKCHEVRYKCVECGLTRINRLTILEHYNAFHSNMNTFVCSQCPKAFKRQVSLRKHIAYVHARRARVQCQYCLRTYANKEVLKSHMIVRHPQEVSAGEVVKRHVCGECGKAFKAPSLLRNHSVKHSHARDFYCVECDKSFKSEAALQRHVKIAAPHVNYLELPLACTRCDKRFAIRRDLERHTNRVHLNIRPFQCDKCDRAYVNNWSLNEHKRFVHEGHKRPLKYPCSMCDKVFDRNQTLKTHVRTHTGERPFPCGRCAAKFAQSSALGTHVRLVHLRLARDGTPRDKEKT